jgi:hypothetical protein
MSKFKLWILELTASIIAMLPYSKFSSRIVDKLLIKIETEKEDAKRRY